MNQEMASRVLIGDSLGFHIIFALLSIGLPLMMLIFEFIAIRTRNSKLLDHVKGWSKIMVILATAGVVSGTLIAMQFSLIWPRFMEIAGPVVGPAFMFEGYFFLLEAIFLALYIASWDKIKGYRHLLIGIPVAIGAIGSAFVITLVNGWMSEPLGFTMVNGEPTNINTLQALFTQTAMLKIAHSVLAYIAATALLMGGVYAFFAYRKKATAATKKLYQTIVYRLMIISAVFTVGTMLFGHASAVYLAENEPVKLAAFEVHYNTGANAPLTVGGSLNRETNEVEGGIQLPNMLSYLVGFSADTEVKGLDTVPQSQWPPLVVHTMFDIKMAAAILMLAVPVVYVLIVTFRDKISWLRRFERPSALVVAASGLLGIIVVELGWMIAEIGRQPYAIKGVLMTIDAFTKDNDVITIGYLFPVSFLILLLASLFAVFVVINKLKGKDFKS